MFSDYVNCQVVNFEKSQVKPSCIMGRVAAYSIVEISCGGFMSISFAMPRRCSYVNFIVRAEPFDGRILVWSVISPVAAMVATRVAAMVQNSVFSFVKNPLRRDHACRSCVHIARSI